MRREHRERRAPARLVQEAAEPRANGPPAVGEGGGRQKAAAGRKRRAPANDAAANAVPDVLPEHRPSAAERKQREQQLRAAEKEAKRAKKATELEAQLAAREEERRIAAQAKARIAELAARVRAKKNAETLEKREAAAAAAEAKRLARAEKAREREEERRDQFAAAVLDTVPSSDLDGLTATPAHILALLHKVACALLLKQPQLGEGLAPLLSMGPLHGARLALCNEWCELLRRAYMAAASVTSDKVCVFNGVLGPAAMHTVGELFYQLFYH